MEQQPEVRISIGHFELTCSESNTELIEKFVIIATRELDRREALREARRQERRDKDNTVAQIVGELLPQLALYLERTFGRRTNAARPDIDADATEDAD